MSQGITVALLCACLAVGVIAPTFETRETRTSTPTNAQCMVGPARLVACPAGVGARP